MTASSKLPSCPAFLLGALLALFALPVRAQPVSRPGPLPGTPYGPPPGRVLFFPGPNFSGEPLIVPAAGALENLEYVRDSRGRKWNDRIASIRVEGPVLLLLYEHADFQGATATLTRDAADLNALSLGDRHGTTWAQRVSSSASNPSGRPPRVSSSGNAATPNAPSAPPTTTSSAVILTNAASAITAIG